jgi:hypothetical protein
MLTKSRKKIRVETMEAFAREASTEEATKAAREEDMEEEVEEDTVVEEYHLSILTMAR